MRIIIADQQPRVRFALKVLLQNQQGFPVVGYAADAKELLSRVQTLRPDIVLIDWNLPGIAPGELIQTIRRMQPNIRTMIMSANPEVQGMALAQGADFYINKGEAPSFLLETLQNCQFPAVNG